MATIARSSKVRHKKLVYVQKPLGQLTERVQRVGPEHFGIVSIDCGKNVSKFMLADSYGTGSTIAAAICKQPAMPSVKRFVNTTCATWPWPSNAPANTTAWCNVA
jgi:hypothetical protein